MPAIAAIDLDKQVESTRRHEQVVHFGKLGNPVRGGIHLTGLDADTDHASSIPLEKLGLDDGDDLQDALIRHLVDAAAHSSLGQAQVGRDLGEGLAPIVLKVGHDGPICLVQLSQGITSFPMSNQPMMAIIYEFRTDVK